MIMASADLNVNKVIELRKYFNIDIDEDTAEMFLSHLERRYEPEEVMKIAEIIGGLRPDESYITEDDYLRLWWD